MEDGVSALRKVEDEQIDLDVGALATKAFRPVLRLERTDG